jgi:hypothetical protein
MMNAEPKNNLHTPSLILNLPTNKMARFKKKVEKKTQRGKVIKNCNVLSYNIFKECTKT